MFFVAALLLKLILQLRFPRNVSILLNKLAIIYGKNNQQVTEYGLKEIRS